MSEENIQVESDAQLEQELIYNERIVEHQKFGKIKFSRPTPWQERLIAEQKRSQHHKDYKNEEILSRSQIMKIAEGRGDWSKDDDKRMNELYQRIGEITGVLYVTEYGNAATTIDKYEECGHRLREIFVGKDDVLEAIDNFLNIDKPKSAKDKLLIMRSASSTEVDALLKDLEVYRGHLETLDELIKTREELQGYIERQSFLFGNTIEARAQQAGEMAKLFHCARNADTGEALWASLDEMWNEQADVIQWLSTEMFYFMNGITEELRRLLGEEQGFSERVIDTKESSESSLDHPQSNSNGELQESEPMSSSLSTE